LRPTPTLHGTACTLRPVIDADAPTLAHILAEEEVSRWWPRYDEERVRGELIEGADTTVFVVEHDAGEGNADDTVAEGSVDVIGAILYVEEPSPDYRHASIDVFLHPDWHGKGIGTDAVRTLARHLVHDRGHHRLAIDPAASNEKAIRAYRRVGFQPVGVMRAYERNGEGEWQDCMLMDLLARDLT
jgi:aminoglycoside 6'-N-acetyltransferase